ncbi:MAG: TonB-dependent receptor [Pseudomonadota bacterium]
MRTTTSALCLFLLMVSFLILLLRSRALAEEVSRKPEPEENKTEKVFFLDEITITATRNPNDTFESPRAMTVVDQDEIIKENQLSLLDTLDDKIGIWVEKRTTTASDPVIRGLSGRNLLALIDGNTLSTLWGEGGDAGDDMYGKIDPDSIERIEVIRGPSSVLYGSNALGGVLNFITKSPPLGYTEKGLRHGFLSRLTYGTADQGFRIRQEICSASPSTRLLLGGSLRDIGDIKGGKGVGRLRPTSGEDKNWDFKGIVKLKENHELEFIVHDVHRTHIHRYYRPNEDNINDREAFALTHRAKRIAPYIEELKTQLYYQYKEDERRFFDLGIRGHAITKTIAADLQFVSQFLPDHRLTYGLHFERDDGESPDDEQFTRITPEGEKKDAPDSIWEDYGAFIQDEWDLFPRLTFTLGLRYDNLQFDSDPDSRYTPAGGLPRELDDIADVQASITGGLGVVVRLNDRLNLVGSYFRGFRQQAPNFGVRQLGYGILVPNELLDPITADTFETGVKFRSDKFHGALITYYTNFDNFQTIKPADFLGQSWYDFNQNGVRDPGEDTYKTRSEGRACLYGIEIEYAMNLELFWSGFAGWSASGGFMWNYGRDRTYDQPLRHTHPARGILKLRWEGASPERGLWFECGADFIRKFDQVPLDRLLRDPGYRKDPQDPGSGLLREYGLPGYSVFDLRGGLKIFALENVANKKYRRAHSRWDEAGINFISSLRLTY